MSDLTIEKHLPGQHDQKSHGRKGAGGGGGSSGTFDAEAYAALDIPGKRKAWDANTDAEKDRQADPTHSIDAAVQRITGDKEWPDTGDLAADVRARVEQFADRLAPDSVREIGDFMEKAVHDMVQIPESDPVAARALAQSMTDHLVAQDWEASGRTLGDHGIRHLGQDAEYAMQMLDALGGDSPRIRTMARIAAVYHDSGYLTDPAHNFLDDRHPEWSSQHFQANLEPLAAAVVGENMARTIATTIASHDTVEMDWKERPFSSAFRVADNLGLFHHEKLPPMMRHVPKNVGVMTDLARGKIDVPTAKQRVIANIDATTLPPAVKEQLKRAAAEISPILPKLSLGMLGGKTKGFSYDRATRTMSVEVERDRANEALSRIIDAGQRQFVKLAETYGVDPQDFRSQSHMEFRSDVSDSGLAIDVTGELLKRFLEALAAGAPLELLSKALGRDDVLKADYQGNGVMIALAIPPMIARRLSVPDGIKPDDMHVTVAYLGKLGDDLDPDDLLALHEGLRLLASTERPLTGRVAGLAQFSAPDPAKTPFVCPVDAPGLDRLRVRVLDMLEAYGYEQKSEHGYSPHLTLGYWPEDRPMPFTLGDLPESDFLLGTLVLGVAGEHVEYPLEGLSKFNANHDPKTGRFTTAGKGGRGGGPTEPTHDLYESNRTSAGVDGVPDVQVRAITEHLASQGISVDVMRAQADAIYRDAVESGVAESAKHWYETAADLCDSTAAEMGVNPKLFKACTAATSPNTDWDHTYKEGSDRGEGTRYPNVEVTRAALQALKDDPEVTFSPEVVTRLTGTDRALSADALKGLEGRTVRLSELDSEVAGIVLTREVLRGSGESTTAGWGAFAKVVDMYRFDQGDPRGVPPEDALSGHKVRSFNNQLQTRGGDPRPTIDTWMFRMMADQPTYHGNREPAMSGTGTQPKWAKGKEFPDRDGVLDKPVPHKSRKDVEQGWRDEASPWAADFAGWDVPPSTAPTPTGRPRIGWDESRPVWERTTAGGHAKVNIHAGSFPVFQQVVIDMAREHGMTPAQMQAILWTQYRNHGPSTR